MFPGPAGQKDKWFNKIFSGGKQGSKEVSPQKHASPSAASPTAQRAEKLQSEGHLSFPPAGHSLPQSQMG